MFGYRRVRRDLLVPVGHRRPRQRLRQAHRQGLRAAPLVHDPGAVRLRHQRRPAAPHRRRCRAGVGFQLTVGGFPPDFTARRHHRGVHRCHRAEPIVGAIVRLRGARLTRARRTLRRRRAPSARRSTPSTSRPSTPRPRRPPTPSPTRSSASSRSRPTTSRPSSARSRPTASAPTSCRAASGRWPAGPACPTTRITLEGVGKTRADLRAAVARRRGRRSAALDRPRVARGGGRAGDGGPPGRERRLDVLYRLNPDVAPETLAGLAVGAGASKFGMDEIGHRRAAIEAGGGADGALRPRGHPPPRRVAARRGRRLARGGAQGPGPDGAVARLDRHVRHAGPGRRLPGPPGRRAGARRRPASPASCRPVARGIPADRRPTRLAIEPGRALVARAGWLLARVLHVRDRAGRQVVLDAGMTELIRPALYGALPPDRRADLRGRALGSGRRRQPDLSPDPRGGPDLRVDRHAGHPRPAAAAARRPRGHRRCRRLCRALGSSYNGRPRPPQVLLGTDGVLTLGRRRGSIAALG